jgi:hypothetical protein
VIINLEHPFNTFEKMMRAIRNDLLAQSDWSQLPDAPCNREAWATYRQALRDFPATWTEGPEADFPDTP